jgi:hypothetical protein
MGAAAAREAEGGVRLAAADGVAAEAETEEEEAAEEDCGREAEAGAAVAEEEDEEEEEEEEGAERAPEAKAATAAPAAPGGGSGACSCVDHSVRRWICSANSKQCERRAHSSRRSASKYCSARSRKPVTSGSCTHTPSTCQAKGRAGQRWSKK